MGRHGGGRCNNADHCLLAANHYMGQSTPCHVVEAIFGEELREAFQLFIAAADRVAVLAQRSVKRLQERLIRARIIFRQITGGTQHEKIVQAEIKREDGKIAQYEAAELVPWHELPDEVREKFIRRQNAAVEIELKLKE